ncbi:hypothetical protein ABIE09_000374 [Lysobacter enzymogenes]
MRKIWLGAAALGCTLAASAAYWASGPRGASAQTAADGAPTNANAAPSPAGVRANGRNALQPQSAAADTPAFTFSTGASRSIAPLLGEDARVSAMAVGDVTGDGRDDLVATTHVENNASPSVAKVLVYVQQTNGTLAPPIKLHNSWDSNAAQDQGLALADMNDDGLLDIVYANGYGVDVALSQGAGQFSWVRSGDYGSYYHSLGVLDIDRDGYADVFAQSYMHSATLMMGTPLRPVSRNSFMNTPVERNNELRIGDITGDGLPDVLITGAGSSLTEFWVYPSRPEGGLGPVRSYQVPLALTNSVAIGDFDNDGRNDVAVSGWGNPATVDGFYVYRQNAAGELDAPMRAPVAYGSERVWAASMWAADFDRDGKTDLVGLNSALFRPSLSLYLQGDQGLQAPQTINDYGATVSTMSTTIGSGDLNGDGCTDLALSGETTLVVYYGRNCKPAPPRPAARDLDGDRKSDLIWRQPALGYLATWRMDGAARASGASYAVGSAWRVVVSGDYNGDGRTDLVWTDGSNMQMWRNDGNGAYTGLPMQAYPSGYRAVASADVNGDGKADLIWQDDSDYYLAVWLMDGASTVGGQAVRLSSSCWIVLGAGDFDGDGRADLLLSDDLDLHMYFGQRDGRLVKSGLGVGSYPRQWTLAGIGDADGDGRSDLFWRHAGAGYLAQWRMLGKYRSAGYSYPVGGDWRVLDVADHDGDGRADLIWTDGKNMQRWKSQGAGNFSGEAMSDYPAGWSLIAPEGAGRRRCPAF